MRLWTVVCEEFPQFERRMQAVNVKSYVGYLSTIFIGGNQCLHITPGHLPSQLANQRRYTHLGCSSLFNYFTPCFQKFFRALRTVCSFSTLTWSTSLIAMFMGPPWGPPGSCRHRVGPMLAPWILLYGIKRHGSRFWVHRLLSHPPCPVQTDLRAQTSIGCSAYPNSGSNDVLLF